MVVIHHISLINASSESLAKDPFWHSYLHLLSELPTDTVSVHIAILRKVYLTKIFSGEKTVESRFARDRRPPYMRVKPGDIIMLKQSGSAISGISYASSVHNFRIEGIDDLQRIKSDFQSQLGVDESFWETYANSSYATLVSLDHVLAIDPVEYPKKDQRSWVILQERSPKSEFSADKM